MRAHSRVARFAVASMAALCRSANGRRVAAGGAFVATNVGRGLFAASSPSSPLLTLSEEWGAFAFSAIEKKNAEQIIINKREKKLVDTHKEKH